MDITLDKKTLKDLGVAQEDLAQVLFPANKHALNALRRLFRGKGSLSAKQAKDLADYLGVTVDSLYSEGGWAVDSSGPVWLLRKPGFVASINPSNNEVLIFKEGEVLARRVLYTNVVMLPLFLKDLDELIRTL